MKDSVYLLVTVFLLLVFACEQNTIEPVPQDITGLWRFVYGVDNALISTDEDLYPIAYIRFDHTQKLYAYTSRNWITGYYKYDPPKSLSFTNLASTKVADTPWSGKYHSVLLGVDEVEVTEDQLTLLNTNLEESLHFILVENCLSAGNDPVLFKNGKSDPFKTLQVKQIEECLEVIISYAGGCQAVNLDLVGSGDYAESAPPQLNVRLILDDDDACEAQITEYFYFNVDALQYEGSSELILNITDYEDPVLIRFDE